MMKWNEGYPKKPGVYLVGVRNDWSNPEKPYIAAEVDEYLGDSLWRYHTENIKYWSEIDALPDGKHVSLSRDNSEMETYLGCCDLLDGLNENFKEIVEYLDIDEDEVKEFSLHISPEKIIRALFLSRTSHDGGTSTARKTYAVLGANPPILRMSLNAIENE